MHYVALEINVIAKFHKFFARTPFVEIRKRQRILRHIAESRRAARLIKRRLPVHP